MHADVFLGYIYFGARAAFLDLRGVLGLCVHISWLSLSMK
jgi:hypothetical protein